MKEAIRRIDLSREFYTHEGCYIIELSNTPDDADASIARARVAPGVTTRWHRLRGTTERYCILSGRARVEIGKLPPQGARAGRCCADSANVPPAHYEHWRRRVDLSGHLHPAVFERCL